MGHTKRVSHPLDETVDHLLLAGLVEIYRQLIAVDLRHPAIAEFLVEHTFADRKPQALGGACRNQRALDGERLAQGRRRRRPARPIALRALPAGRLVESVGEQIRRRVEPARPIASRHLLLGHLDMIDRKLVDESRGERGLPGAMIAPVLGKGDLGALARPGQPDMRKPALFFQSRTA